jgi:prophage regulatory protein
MASGRAWLPQEISEATDLPRPKARLVSRGCGGLDECPWCRVQRAEQSSRAKDGFGGAAPIESRLPMHVCIVQEFDAVEVLKCAWEALTSGREMTSADLIGPDRSCGVTPAFYRIGDVLRITALSRPTIYRRIAAGRFPAPVHLGGRICAWSQASLASWIANPDKYRASQKCGASSLRTSLRHSSTLNGHTVSEN